MRRFALLPLLVLAALTCLAACANTNPPREQPALPTAPQYPATLVPSPTPLPPTRTPTLLPPTLNAVVAVPTPRPTELVRRVPQRDAAALYEYHRGIAYVTVNRDEYRSDESRQALDELFTTGANYISILVTWYQTDRFATEIYRADNTPSDEDVAFVIDYAHAHGIKVLLKPQVNLSFDDEHWRGEIEFQDEALWQAWFQSYRNFILYYARFAQKYGVEEFSAGTELVGTATRAADWRAIIRAIRQEYTGFVTYSANHSGEEIQIRWWDEVDYIGVNVFYHLTRYRTPTMQQLLEGWKIPVTQLTTVHRRFPDKPMIFTEVGYPSMDLASVWPYNWQRDSALDLDEQALLYEALFQTWWYHPEREWFRGMYIWNWLAHPDQGGLENKDYTPHGKPAEQVLRQYYQFQRPAPPKTQ
jgi:hypothetical protein